ncbi:MAG: membrane-associated phospholipid phosphatase [Flavobacteriaceae bacterium]|jgi:membrane-associated phospholipid phosphatase
MNRIHYYVLTIFLIISFNAKSQNTTAVDAGDILILALPVASLTSTFIIGDAKGRWQFTKGFLLSGGVTFGIKMLVDKSRPDKSNKNSFPSGHTSISFHSAAFIHHRYGITYAIPAYALASFTGLTRIYGEKHDGFDVLIGAVIGIGSAYLFTSPYQQEHMQLTFSSDNENYLMGFRFKF